MPLKFTKEITTHLFKYVRRVDIQFNRKCNVVSMDWNKACDGSTRGLLVRDAFALTHHLVFCAFYS